MKKLLLALLMVLTPALCFAEAGLVTGPTSITLKGSGGTYGKPDLDLSNAYTVIALAPQHLSPTPIVDPQGYYYNQSIPWPPFTQKVYNTPAGWYPPFGSWDNSYSTILFKDTTEQPATMPLVVEIIVDAMGLPPITAFVTPNGGTRKEIDVFSSLFGTTIYPQGRDGVGPAISMNGASDATRFIEFGSFSVPVLAANWYGANYFAVQDGQVAMGASVDKNNCPLGETCIAGDVKLYSGVLKANIETVKTTCAASASCSASCSASPVQLYATGASCSALPQISPLDFDLWTTSMTCNAGAATSDLNATIICSKVAP